MNETFISYLWKYRRLNVDLVTESGEPLVVLHPGEQNSDGGPDFFNARLKIGNTTWAGNVEIHLRSSDWYKHGHQGDLAYRNAILHVVFEDDYPVRYPDGVFLQTLTVKDRFPEYIFDRYLILLKNEQWIPCYNQLKTITVNGFNLWAPGLAIERLVNKSDYIRQLWESCLYNWDEAFYRHLAWCFGFRVNNVPFELLARSLPLKVGRQHFDNIFQTEALLFGLAGMLEGRFSDEYPNRLCVEYQFLKSKYKLEPVAFPSWKYLRMRPSNFPTIRISQWAKFLNLTGGRFFHLLEHGDVHQIVEQTEIFTSEYWDTHYMFDKPSVFSRKTLGKDSIKLLIINGIAPFLFFYGYEKDQPSCREKALGFLEQIGCETNAVTNRWKDAGLKCENAMHSQALLQLKRFYCDRKRCLECRIGSELLTS
ncbi:MAG: DUF2851 family protein [Bacteroidetes bacterium]|nr:DUF2851 family protein [Bacteroidota bacterium]